MTADELRDARYALQIPQRELAARLGVHLTTVSRYETGELKIPRTVELAVLHLVCLKNLVNQELNDVRDY